MPRISHGLPAIGELVATRPACRQSARAIERLSGQLWVAALRQPTNLSKCSQPSRHACQMASWLAPPVAQGLPDAAALLVASRSETVPGHAFMWIERS